MRCTVELYATCMLVDRGLRRAVDAPSRVRLSTSAAGHVKNPPLTGVGRRLNESRGEGHHGTDIHRHCAHDELRILTLQRPDRLQHAGVVHEHRRSVLEKPGHRIRRQKSRQRSTIGDVELKAVHLISFNAAGEFVEIEKLVRPVEGVKALGNAMAGLIGPQVKALRAAV